MTLSISDRFNYSRLLRFTFPSVMMMLFTSVYVIADGYFVSNWVGKTALAAVNFAYPILMILGCIGFMFGTGASALISKKLGEGKADEANSIFSFIVIFSIVLGLFLTVLGLLFIDRILALMGATGELLEMSSVYAKIIVSSLPFYILQYEFQCLFVTADKPRLGLYVTVAAGMTNIVFDALFIAVFQWGIKGGATATAMSQVAGGLIPLVYFMRKNSSRLKLKRHFTPDWKNLGIISSNGMSEFLSNVSASVVGAVYNLQLLKYSGEDGLAAYGVIMYVGIVFVSLFIGYSVGSAPIIGYNYGAGDRDHLKKIVKESYVIIAVESVLMFLLSLVLARPLGLIFVSYDRELLEFTIHAFILYSISFLFCGFSMYSSSLFTALNNGLVSAVISFMRSLVFQIACVLIIPVILGSDGIWLATVFSELLSLILSVTFVLTNRKKYGY